MEPVQGGWDTAMWRFPTADGAWHALRVFRRPGQAATARREQAALAAAAAGGVPVPHVEAAGEWQGLPAVVLTWSPGERLVSAIQRRPWALWRLGLAFGQVQARIHALPAPPALKHGAPLYWLARAGAKEAALVERLLALRPSTDTLVHLDYHPLNVLTDGRRITGVVDWANAAAGDRRADIAWTTFLLEVGPIPPGPLRPALAAARRLLYLAWRRGYERAAGPVADLTPFMVWAGTVVLHEVEPRMDEPQVWANEGDLEAIRRWTARWKARAGLA